MALLNFNVDFETTEKDRNKSVFFVYLVQLSHRLTNHEGSFTTDDGSYRRLPSNH